jgi:cell shape-determining protein MreC
VLSGEAEKLAEIDSGDLERIEDLLDHVIESRKELKKEEEELEALKEDITEYREVKSIVLCAWF